MCLAVLHLCYLRAGGNMASVCYNCYIYLGGRRSGRAVVACHADHRLAATVWASVAGNTAEQCARESPATRLGLNRCAEGSSDSRPITHRSPPRSSRTQGPSLHLMFSLIRATSRAGMHLLVCRPNRWPHGHPEASRAVLLCSMYKKCRLKL